jgi:L,D-transpeptidase YcbB
VTECRRLQCGDTRGKIQVPQRSVHSGASIVRCHPDAIDHAIYLRPADRTNQSQTFESRHRRPGEKIQPAGIHCSTGCERRNIQSVLDQIEPPYAGYRRIENTLKQYLDLAAKGDGAKVPGGTKTIAPGDTYAGTVQLADRLQLLGDLPQGGSFDSYSGALVDGVKHFQARHGLAADGKLDAATLRELNTPLVERVQQIDDALERWRWMPTEFQQPPVLVNIPEFRLRAYSDDHQLALSMNVVVGKAAPTQTPVFTDEIKFIVFRPYWNVPPGILRNTVIPGLLKSSGYLARERFEVTDSSRKPVSPSDDLVAGLRSGKYSYVRSRDQPMRSA